MQSMAQAPVSRKEHFIRIRGQLTILPPPELLRLDFLGQYIGETGYVSGYIDSRVFICGDVSIIVEVIKHQKRQMASFD